MFVSVGSDSNVAEDMAPTRRAAQVHPDTDHPLGAAWDSEENRADVLEFDPEGKELRVYATGIRNCVTVPINPADGAVWCATNERDGLGDNLPPDYVTEVRPGRVLWLAVVSTSATIPIRVTRTRGPIWPAHITIPDVLIQPHSAPLQGVFYDGAMFPALRGSLPCRAAWLLEPRDPYRRQDRARALQGRQADRRL